MFKNPERFNDYNNLTKEKTDALVNTLSQRVKKNIDCFKSGFPAEISNNNIYPIMDHKSWVEGFYTGILWLFYEMTGDEIFKTAGEECLEFFKTRIETKDSVNNHDMGFLYSLSCIAQYKITKNKTAMEAAVLAARTLSERFHEKGQFIQAWGDVGDENEYRLIVDCLMNLPLLKWAYDETKEDGFLKIAKAHFDTTRTYAIRDTGSAYHTYFFDKETGNAKYGKTHQGFSDDSAWSRGQAWCIYGIALGSEYSKEDVTDLWHKVTDYYLDNLPDDKIAYWDLCFKEGNEPRDASSSVIAVCGILEAYKRKICGEEYLHAAKSILNAIIDKCQPENTYETNGLLSRSTYARNSYSNEECTIWGDYFLAEALMRLKNPDWNMYWM